MPGHSVAKPPDPSEAVERSTPTLSDRQEAVLRAVVLAYVGEATPVGSRTVSQLLSRPLSAASVRNTMTELAERGLVEKPHRSAGRIPTAAGLRAFVERAPRRALGRYERRDLEGELEGAALGDLIERASRVLSERTRQLGFAIPPRPDRLVLRHVSFVRLSSESILAVLVSECGVTLRPVIPGQGSDSQGVLDRVAGILNERLGHRTLMELRQVLAREARELRSDATGLLARAARLGAQALAATAASATAELVLPNPLVLLDHPEFRDPERLRELLTAIEDRERLLEILDRMMETGTLRVAVGEDLGGAAWRSLGLVAAPFGPETSERGVIGVIGPRRMDYPRVMALVDYLSLTVTEKLTA